MVSKGGAPRTPTEGAYTEPIESNDRGRRRRDERGHAGRDETDPWPV